MLLGKGIDFGSLHKVSKSIEKGDEKFLQGVDMDYDIGSDDQLTSDNPTNRQKVEDGDKIPNDKETFNSATSSAAFISMTNSIKMFKIKLRSLNTPKLLYWLNVAFIIISLLIATFYLCLWLEEKRLT